MPPFLGHLYEYKFVYTSILVLYPKLNLYILSNLTLIVFPSFITKPYIY